MIPYDELCDALARWRSRNGLANGPSARPPQGPLAVPTAAPAPPATGAAGAAFGAAVGPVVTDEHDLVEQRTAITANPLAAEPAWAEPADGDAEGDVPTGVHQAAPERPLASLPAGESTSEIDLEADNVLLVDEGPEDPENL